MEAFTTLDAVAVPLDRANVDTDAIIPKQFMKSIARTGFGDNLFDEWRYHDRGEAGVLRSQRRPRADFPLNQPAFAGAQILLTRENFGCGSSREHAPWALRDFGIRAIVAPSFADIFHGNCFKNGILPIVLPAEWVERLFGQLGRHPGQRWQIDLAERRLQAGPEVSIHFQIDALRAERLLHGLDDIGLTLARAERIRAYEERRRSQEPWLFPAPH
jgi:3-isopropylmalate/(R)-2-methylmalate dehydratase small subunit